MRKFMRPPGAAPAPTLAHTTDAANGHANGVGSATRKDELYSTLSEDTHALWQDPQFPATWRALGERRLAAAGLRWLRPHELCVRPRFRGDDAEPDEAAPDEGSPDLLAARWSVVAGELGGAHVCRAAAALALTPRLLERALPPQGFGARYSGVFRFRFWVFGAWREVQVDDRLPTRGGRLLASRGALPDDFTLPLLEKAYAKLYGSYAALRGGDVARALQDLSGGIVQSFELRRLPRQLTLRLLESVAPRSTLLVASAAQGPSRRSGARDAAPPGQMYCVTELTPSRAAGESALLRVRAVGGGENGPPPGPGDRWMPLGDFARSFERLDLVHVGPDDWLAEPALRDRTPWRGALARRRWRVGHSAGGPPGAPTAHANPQFHVQVRDAARLCHVVVSVTRRYAVPESRAAHPRAVGFALYELPGGAAPRRPADRALLAELRPLDVTHRRGAREAATLFTLRPGRYLVVPHASRAHAEAAFLLRVLTDEHADVWEMNEDNVVVHDVAAELLRDERTVPAKLRAAVAKLFAGREAEEVDAAALHAAPRRVWRACSCPRPSPELCRALVALRDEALAGAVRVRDVPALLALLSYWRAVFVRECGAARASSYALRGLLRAAGVTASNKVLECLVLRFARGTRLGAEDFALALARLQLAHERYRELDARSETNPFSLEEMILMTVYS